MTYAKLQSISSGVRGTHYAPGMSHVYFVKNNNNTGSTVGQLARIRVTPVEKVSDGNILINGGDSINLDSGLPDVRWVKPQQPAAPFVQRLATTTIYKFPAPPANGLLGIDPVTLIALPYKIGDIPENGQGNSYFAAKTPLGNYAVFRIYQGSAPGTTMIEWITYKMNTNHEIIGFNYADPRDVVISEDFDTAYVSGLDEFGIDRVFAVSNSGSTNAPSYSIMGGPSGYAIDVPPQPLVATAQLAIDPANSAAIYVVDATALWRIEINADTTKVVDIPNGGRGLLIDNNRIAIISDIQGNLFEVDLASPSPTLTPLHPSIGNLGGPSGFLTWADETKTSFFATVLDPVNSVRQVNPQMLESNEYLNLQTLAQPLLNPWSVEVFSPSRMFMATEGEVGTLELSIASNALVLGIGLVPFDYIIQDPNSQDRGKADTTPATGYFYQVNKVPFGGNLNLMINHPKAHNAGLRFFRVTLTQVGAAAGKFVTESFTDLRWKSDGGTPKFYETPVSSTGATPPAGTPAHAYPIRPPNELWYNAYLGTIMPARIVENAVVTIRNGLYEMKVEFFDQSGQLVVGETKTYVILLDNNLCNAALFPPRIGNPPPLVHPMLDCGCIAYVDKNEKIALDFKAWQLNGAANYTLRLYRGGKILPHLTQMGTTNTSDAVQTKTTTNLPLSPTFKVGHMLGDCNVASIRVDISVLPRAIDGYRWVGALSGSKTFDFTLVPSSVPMSTPWTDPNN